MSRLHIVDTGPLVALLSARDHHHSWARRVFATVEPPVLTCEAVLAETWHLLGRTAKGHNALLELMTTGAIASEFSLKEELTAVRRLATRYSDRPMSLADACLVRMSELYDQAAVLTLDKDFVIYRKNGRQVIPVVSPFV